MNEIVTLYKFVNIINPTHVQKKLKSRLRELKTVSSAEKNEVVEKAENVIEPETPAENGLVEGQSEENTPTKVEE